MSKVTYPIIKVAERVFFNDGGKYVLLDTGCPMSIAIDGKIGPFAVNAESEKFIDDFINLTMPDGSKVRAILSPMSGYNCLLTQTSVTVTDGQEALPEHDYFLPFVETAHPWMREKLPIVEGAMNGTPIRFFFDSGARMTMFGETELTGGRPAVGSYTEWMGMLHKHETLSVYDMALDFPCGLHFEGKSAFVPDTQYRQAGMAMGFRAMLGIDLLNDYDLYISTANHQRGIALKKRP